MSCASPASGSGPALGFSCSGLFAAGEGVSGHVVEVHEFVESWRPEGQVAHSSRFWKAGQSRAVHTALRPQAESHIH